MFLLDQADPAAVALYDSQQSETITYAALSRLADQLGQALRAGQKSLIFHFGRNDLVSLAWYLGAMEAGHAVALLDEGLAPALKQQLITLYQPEWIVYSHAGVQLGELDSYAAVKVSAPGAFALARTQTASDEERSLNPELALLLSTSGSTGSPKFVRLTRRNIVSNAESIATALELDGTECAITSLPFYYSYGLSVLNTHLLRSGRLALTRESIVAPGFWSAFRAAHCTSFAGVPYTYEMLSRRIKLSDLDLPTLRVMTQAGGKLADRLVSEFHGEMQRRNGRFYVMYGQTEATARIAILPWDRLPEKLGSAGRAIPGGAIVIDTDDGQSDLPDASGELLYRGPNVMLGYATCRADLAKGDEQHGELRTGDFATLDREGFVFIKGRMKRDAKLFGMRVNLDEVEALLRGHATAAAIATGEKITIFCEGEGDLEAFRTHLATTLRVHPTAFAFRAIERLPLNANGKIDYTHLGGLL